MSLPQLSQEFVDHLTDALTTTAGEAKEWQELSQESIRHMQTEHRLDMPQLAPALSAVIAPYMRCPQSDHCIVDMAMHLLVAHIKRMSTVGAEVLNQHPATIGNAIFSQVVASGFQMLMSKLLEEEPVTDGPKHDPVPGNGPSVH